MPQKEALGYITCPTCGTHDGMRITHDKNGDPFGYCEANCGQQMRIGGDKRRVRDFLARFPQFAPKAEPAAATSAEPVPVPVVTVPVAEPKPPAKPAEPAKPAKKRTAFDDVAAIFGVN